MRASGWVVVNTNIFLYAAPVFPLHVPAQRSLPAKTAVPRHVAAESVTQAVSRCDLRMTSGFEGLFQSHVWCSPTRHRGEVERRAATASETAGHTATRRASAQVAVIHARRPIHGGGLTDSHAGKRLSGPPASWSFALVAEMGLGKQAARWRFDAAELALPPHTHARGLCCGPAAATGLIAFGVCAAGASQSVS